MFFIYKEQAFTLPVWGFSTLAVSTDWEVRGAMEAAVLGRGLLAQSWKGGGVGMLLHHPPNKPVIMSAIAFRFMKLYRCLHLNPP